MQIQSQSTTMTERECASPLCDESFAASPPWDDATYCSRECYHQEKAYDDQAPSKDPARERYIRRWVLRVKWNFGKRE